MKHAAKIICFFCGAYYSLVGALLFFAPAFFFHKIAPIGPYNHHYAVDLGSFLLPLGLFLLWVVRYVKWSKPVIGLAAFASALHLLSHLRDGLHSPGAVLADTFFLVVALLLIIPLVLGREVRP